MAYDGTQDGEAGEDGRLVRQVAGEGPSNARIVLVGEAPGEAECSHRRPFVGASGGLLDTLLRAHGMDRRYMRVENVCERRPQGNDITNVPRDELEAWGRDVRRRVAEHAAEGAIVVPMGSTALNAVMDWRVGVGTVMKYRGTVLRKGGYTVLPTIHPAAVLRQPSLMRRVGVDWGRVAKLAQGVDISAPERQLVVAGRDMDMQQAFDLLWSHVDAGRPLSIDIETLPPQRKITCVGFAPSATLAVTFSTWWPDYMNGIVHGDMRQAQAWIKLLCETANAKIGQNFVGYDTPWLRDIAGTEVHGRVFDTRWMHHAMYPSDGGDSYVGRSGFVGEDHGLAYLASVYTAEPFWKDEAKSTDRYEQLRYNSKDCAVTFEIWERLCEELHERGQWGYYEQAYEALYECLGDVEHLGMGVRMDMKARKRKLHELANDAANLVQALDDLAGVDRGLIRELEAQTSNGERGKVAAEARRRLKAEKAKCVFGEGGGVSPVKVVKFLEGVCGLKLPKKKDSTARATDEVTLRQQFLRASKDSLAKRAIPLLLDYRSVTKQGTFLAEKNYGTDARVRCTYTMLPETGRLSSQGDAFGGGMNLQNIMREVRDVFTADEGHVLLEVDLSTAEDRVVKMLTRDKRMIELARTKPWELDQHRYNAACMFGIPEAQVSKHDRDVVKRTGHATSYGMKPPRMSEQWLKDSEGQIVRTPAECKYLQDLYIGRVMPNLPDWQASIRAEIMQHRCLSNPFGRILDLTWERLDDDTYKRGYAFKPQSTVGMLVNVYGLRPVWDWLRRDGKDTRARIAIQLHDAVYFSVPPENVYCVAEQFQRMLERPVVYYGQPMTIPCCFKVGTRWGKGTEWKRLPSKDEMTAVAMEALRDEK